MFNSPGTPAPSQPRHPACRVLWCGLEWGGGSRLGQRWEVVFEVGELTFFRLPPLSPWSAKKEETLPYLPLRAQANPRNWVQNEVQSLG